MRDLGKQDTTSVANAYLIHDIAPHNKTIIEYKGRWNEIKCTIWIWICALLCTLYIVVGIPLLKYLNRSDDETEEVTKEVTKDTPKKVHNDTAHHTMYIRNLIAKPLAISNSAFNSSRLM